MADNKLLLHAEKIDKKFGPTHAVKEVSLDFYAGEIHALIGENGSGKSTFTNMLTGILPIGGGTFTLDGEQIAPKNQVDGNHHGVAVIVQELGTLNGLTVAENLFLGDEDRFMKYGIKNTAAAPPLRSRTTTSRSARSSRSSSPRGSTPRSWSSTRPPRPSPRTVARSSSRSCATSAPRATA